MNNAIFKSYIHSIPKSNIPFFCLGGIRMLLAERENLVELRHIKAVQRYLGASFIGYLTSKFLICEKTEKIHLSAAAMFGSWAVSVLAMDAFIDDSDVDDETLHEFMLLWTKYLTCTYMVSGSYSGNLHKGKFAKLSLSTIQDTIKMADDIAIRVSGKGLNDLHEVQQRFLHYANDLAQGQAASHNQKKLHPRYNLHWYLTEVLPKKTEPFLLAPMVLCDFTGVSHSKFNDFIILYQKMSKPYGHWQIQDDIADLPKDLAGGIISTPGYLLIAQGDLAMHLKDKEIESSTEFLNRLKEIIQKTGIMDSRFVGKYMPEQKHPGESAEDIIRLALCNQPEDFKKPLADIIRKSTEARNIFIRELRTQNARGAVEILKSQKVLNRLLPAIMPEQGEWIDDEHDRNIASLVGFLEKFIRRATARAMTLENKTDT